MKKKNKVEITGQGPIVETTSDLFGDVPLPKDQGSEQGFEYVSSSTIDNPPEVKEERTKPANQTWKGERYFLVNLILKLTPTGGQAVTIPVFCETTRGTMVEEMIELAMQDKRTLGIIRSVLDNPKDRVAGDEIDEDPQGKLF